MQGEYAAYTALNDLGDSSKARPCGDLSKAQHVNRIPTEVGCDGNPRGRLEIAAGETRLTGLSSYLTSHAARIVVSAHSRRQFQAFTVRLSFDIGTKRPATLWSVRTVVCGPNGAGRATDDRRESNEWRLRSLWRSRTISCTCAKVTPQSYDAGSRAAKVGDSL